MPPKKSRAPPPETCLMLPSHPALVPGVEIVDTHTHILSTFSAYASKYPPPAKHLTVKDFVKDVLQAQGVTAVVDVWCEAPVTPGWREVVDSLAELKAEDGLSYHFVIGAHPHAAKDYDERAEAAITEAHKHELCVGWGEIGLDYHYDNSPREIQREVLRRQLRSALKSGLGKAITIHTREADEDIFNILTTELPREQKLHIHCYTDTPLLASKLLSHFPNLFIGITGVITFSTNTNTSSVIRLLGLSASPPPKDPSPASSSSSSSPSPSASGLRIVLETDAPYMIPSNLPPPSELGMKSGQKMPFSHSGMIPWTAAFVAKVLNEGKEEGEGMEGWWRTEDVLRVARDNARLLYGV